MTNAHSLTCTAIIVSALVVGLPAAAQPFDEAVAAARSGDFETALRGFTVAAENGNVGG